MSIYGDIVCKQCRVIMWLGKAVRRPDRSVMYFHRGSRTPLNSKQSDLTRALWKFMADHVGHSMKVVLDEDEEFEEVAEYVDIGGDAITDIPFDQYLKDWPG